MNIDEILLIRYPAEIAAGKIRFVEENDGQGVVISHWDMDIPQPSRDEILQWYEANARTASIVLLKNECLALIQMQIDAVAQAKEYQDGVSCASYAASSNLQWSQQAQAFILWRDSVWTYAYNLLALYSQNSEPLPSAQDVINGMPAIDWPN
jgi:hypothetical protein